uniref:Enhancer of polycomb-like protein n=1 Tax=Anthurium amnicola TaxID=1678845 RepID=A0A1D1Y2P3_9ARAE
MRRHARSEGRGVVREIGGAEPEKIGSRVFPLRGPPASMPSVGARRSTRVFVRKNVSKVAPDGDATTARVLRSGKRLTVSKPEGNMPGGGGDGGSYGWMGFLGSSRDADGTGWWKGKKEGFGSGKEGKEGHLVKCRFHSPEGLNLGDDPVEDELTKCVLKEESAIPSLCGKAFGVVYSRKRRRSHSDGSDLLYSQSGMKDSRGGSNSLSDKSCSSSSMLEDKDTKDCRRYGIAFVRKPRSKKPKLSSLEAGRLRSSKFSDKGVEITGTARCFADKVGILERLAASLFSLHGIHFLPLENWKSNFSSRIAMSGTGFCVIFGSRPLLPLVSVNFSALPFLFKSWHLSISIGFLYLPSIFARYQRQWHATAPKEGVIERNSYDSRICAETDTSKMEIISVITPATKESDVVCSSGISLDKEVSSVTGAPEMAVRNSAVISSIKVRKRRRKRSSLRSGRVSSRSVLKSRRNSLLDERGMLKVDTKVHPVNEGCEYGPIPEKPLDSYLGEGGTLELAMPSPTSPNQKRRHCTMKNSLPRIKELKPAFTEAKQNIDMLSCTANILVIESDRCWREEGAKVILESSGSNDWFLAIKLGDTTRFLLKPEEMKASSSNRYTHATMWAVEGGWKLEFCDKNDWNVFKELHKECCERNVPEVPVRIIPVPGVLEVSGYEESLSSFFMRPDSYIHMSKDEVDRVLLSENACYDMDSGDEEWLERMNSWSLSTDADRSTQISKDNFEKIIFAFEKAAYNHPDVVSDQEKAINLCSDFGKRDIVAALFDYWMKKRKQKHSALVRFFQRTYTKLQESPRMCPLDI